MAEIILNVVGLVGIGLALWASAHFLGRTFDRISGGDPDRLSWSFQRNLAQRYRHISKARLWGAATLGLVLVWIVVIVNDSTP